MTNSSPTSHSLLSRWRSLLPCKSSSLPAPDQTLAQLEDLRLLDRALAQLPADLRAVFTLSELEELTFTEIALALELPRGTVASRVRRAKERFTQAVRRLKSEGMR